MHSHRRRIHRRLRATALGLAACALLIPAVASALPTDDATGRAYDNKIATLSPSELSAAWGVAADGSKLGDTPADFPGTSGAPEVLVAPVTVPGHTIVREVDDVLPLILAGVALLIALATAAYTLRGVLSARRDIVRPSH